MLCCIGLIGCDFLKDLSTQYRLPKGCQSRGKADTQGRCRHGRLQTRFLEMNTLNRRSLFDKMKVACCMQKLHLPSIDNDAGNDMT